MTSKLLARLCKQITLEAAWRVIQENARASTSKQIRQEVDDFSINPGLGLRSIQYRLSRGKFVFKAAKGVLSPKRDSAGRKTGKFRPIVLAPLESRIVQRALLDVLIGFPKLELYANTRFSFGGVRKPIKKVRGSKERCTLGVPAAIEAVLAAIEGGARFYAGADIKSFFTRISKSDVLEIIDSVVDDPEFLAFLKKAIVIELENMAELREHSQSFPIEDIGVAQGNSLSPLLGNITLAKFDLEMNKSSNCCIRYVDDFLVLGKTEKAVNSQLRKAKRLLHELNMELSPEKSTNGARAVNDGLSFLGIEIVPGYIRPTLKKQSKLISSIEYELKKSQDAFLHALKGKPLPDRHSLIATFKRVDGMIDAWGKSYRFCNDAQFFQHTDQIIQTKVRSFLGVYRDIRAKMNEEKRDALLGITKLGEQKRSPLIYPQTANKNKA